MRKGEKVSVRERLPAVLALVLVLLLSGCSRPATVRFQTDQDQCIDRGWPQEGSDLPVDPALVFGRLENGLRTVIMVNHQPKGRVALYLDVQAGSLNETDEQRGVAHFLEHMLFNGTQHYPPGTLIDYFQSIGMSFGADTNAHTGYDETVYKLLLPSADRKTLEEGLTVIADYARGALLLPGEIDRERGVILAEKRSRDSAEARISRKRLQAEFAGSRVALRDPIGLEKVIRFAGAETLRAYYDAWYRPENMVLIMVGDLDPDMARELIREHLSGLRASGPLPSCYDIGRVKEGSRDFVFLPEPDLGRTELGLSLTWNLPLRIDTRLVERRSLEEYLAASILEKRLERMLAAANAPLTRTRVYSGTFVRRLGYFALYGSSDREQWRQGLALLARTMHQVLRFGVTDREMERARREILAELRKNAATAASRDSSRLAAGISRRLNGFEVIMSPAQELALVEELLQEVTGRDVEGRLAAIWNRSRRVVSVAGTAVTDKGDAASAREEIRTTWNRAFAEEVAPWHNEDGQAFPYLDAPLPVPAVVRTVEHEGIGARTVVLENGVRINVLQTDFEKGEVRVAVHFGQGLQAEPRPGLGRLAEAVVRESGVGRLNKEQLEEALSGHSFSVRFSVGEESFSFSGRGLSSELALMLRLIQTGLADPSFRTEAYERVMKRFAQMYAAMEGSVDGRLRLEGDRFFASGHPGYGFPEQRSFMALTLDQVRDWLAPVFARPDLEISIVGDVAPGRAVRLAAELLGGLAPARKETEKRRAPAVFPVGQQKVIRVSSPVHKAIVAVGWPTADYWNISRTRRLSVLAALFEDRLRKTVREELGAAYSPVVYNRSSRVDQGYGVLRCLLTVAPEEVERIRAVVLAIGEELRAKEVDAAELERIVAPILTSIRDMQRNNRYWLESVLALSSRHPEQLQWPLTIVRDFGAITSGEINKLARRFLRPEQAASLVIVSEQQK